MVNLVTVVIVIVVEYNGKISVHSHFSTKKFYALTLSEEKALS